MRDYRHMAERRQAREPWLAELIAHRMITSVMIGVGIALILYVGAGI